jgi:hypothetical protein
MDEMYQKFIAMLLSGISTMLALHPWKKETQNFAVFSSCRHFMFPQKYNRKREKIHDFLWSLIKLSHCLELEIVDGVEGSIFEFIQDMQIV